jgi:hypothetical protein
MGLDWPTAWDQSAWGAVLSGLAFVAAVVAAVLAGGARREARQQRTGFRRARLLRALDGCRSLVDDARQVIRDDTRSTDLGPVLEGWNAAAGDITANLYDGCGIDEGQRDLLHHTLDAVGRERSLLLVWLDVGAAGDTGPLRSALDDAARQLDHVRTEIERRSPA